MGPRGAQDQGAQALPPRHVRLERLHLPGGRDEGGPDRQLVGARCGPRARERAREGLPHQLGWPRLGLMGELELWEPALCSWLHELDEKKKKKKKKVKREKEEEKERENRKENK